MLGQRGAADAVGDSLADSVTVTSAALGEVNPGNDSDASHTRVERLFGDGFEDGSTAQWSGAVP